MEDRATNATQRKNFMFFKPAHNWRQGFVSEPEACMVDEMRFSHWGGW